MSTKALNMLKELYKAFTSSSTPWAPRSMVAIILAAVVYYNIILLNWHYIIIWLYLQSSRDDQKPFTYPKLATSEPTHYKSTNENKKKQPEFIYVKKCK